MCTYVGVEGAQHGEEAVGDDGAEVLPSAVRLAGGRRRGGGRGGGALRTVDVFECLNEGGLEGCRRVERREGIHIWREREMDVYLEA